MPIIGNQEPYTPAGVVPFALIKPTAPADQPQAADVFNDELAAIQAAFGNLSSLPIVTADTGLGATTRNVLVDLSGLADTNTGLVITLPTSPNVGDPPCVVIVQKSGLHSMPGNFEACAIITSTDAIRGFAQDNVYFSSQIPLFNPGDVAVCTYMGGNWGWDISFKRSACVNPIGFSFPAIGSFPCPGVDILIYQNGSTGYGPDTPAWNFGDRFSVTGHSHPFTIGDDTYSFNGVVGPYVTSADDRRYEFVSLGGLDFRVIET
jgi:hypothetical protein